MPNPMKGEAKLGEYTLAFNTAAFCELEDLRDMKMGSLLDAMQNGLGFTELRDFVLAGLHTHHPGADEATALGIIDEHGYADSAQAVGKAVAAFFGKSKEANPPKAAAA